MKLWPGKLGCTTDLPWYPWGQMIGVSSSESFNCRNCRQKTMQKPSWLRRSRCSMPSLSNSAKELWPRKVRAEFLSEKMLFLSSLFAWKRKKQSPQCINKDCFSKWMLSFSKCRFQNIPKIDAAWNGPLLQWLGAPLPKAEKPTTPRSISNPTWGSSTIQKDSKKSTCKC